MNNGLDLTGNYFTYENELLIFLTKNVAFRIDTNDIPYAHTLHNIINVSSVEEFARTRNWTWVNEIA